MCVWTSASVGIILYVCCQITAIGAHSDSQDGSATPLGQPKQLKKEDWESPHYELYARPPSAPIGYNRTLELIKQLNDIYAPYSDEETNGRNWRIANLLRASQRNPDDCNREWLEKLQELLDYNGSFATNVLPYVRHNLIEMKDYCERNAHQILRQRVDDLGQTEHDDMDNLLNKLLKGRKLTRMHLNELWANQGQLVDGIVQFLEEKNHISHTSDGSSKRSRGESELKMDFDHYVIKMCDLWTHATKPIVGLRHYGLHVHLTNTETDWIRYNDVCDLIVRDKKTISKRVHKKFTRNVLGPRSTRFKEGLNNKLKKLGVF